MGDVERDAEIRAMEALIEALEPLGDDARARVLDYTLKRLGMREIPPPSPSALTVHEMPERPQLPRAAPLAEVVDIRSLRTEKAPTTANEMAAIVAYYLAEAAPEAERKETVTRGDIERLFKQAGYPLPTRIDTTLSNATAAGYFDTAGRGEYKLNPVGYNLVTQNLPKSSVSGSSRAKPTRNRKRSQASGTRSQSKTRAASKKTGAAPKKKRAR